MLAAIYCIKGPGSSKSQKNSTFYDSLIRNRWSTAEPKYSPSIVYVFQIEYYFKVSVICDHRLKTKYVFAQEPNDNKSWLSFIWNIILITVNCDWGLKINKFPTQTIIEG